MHTCSNDQASAPLDFIVGDNAFVEVQFRNDNNLPADPDTVTFRFTAPDGTVTTYVYGTDTQLIRDGRGEYHVVLTLSQAGTWTFVWLPTGAEVQKGSDGSISVRQPLS